MPSNLKKLIQARRAKTGESYQTTLAVRVLAEAVDEPAAQGGGNAAVEPHVADPEAFAHLGRHGLHPLPLGEDDGLVPPGEADLLEQPLELVELRGAARLLVHEPRRVAGHARALECAHEPLLLHRGERPPLQDREEPRHGRLAIVVDVALLLRQGNREPGDEPLGEVREHLLLAPTKQNWGGQGSEKVEVPVARGAAGLVERRELLVEPPERTEEVRVRHLHQAVEVVEPVLERRAREHEGEAAPDALHHRGRARAPVLDALRLVDDEQVRGEVEDLPLVGADELVARDEDRRRIGVESAALLAPARHHGDVLLRELRELPDLAQPLVLQRRGAHNERPPHLAPPPEPGHGGDGLGRLAEAHLVGEERPSPRGEEGDALHLVRIELHA
jgi:hypothetical protein